jgi:hypothetical protein
VLRIQALEESLQRHAQVRVVFFVNHALNSTCELVVMMVVLQLLAQLESENRTLKRQVDHLPVMTFKIPLRSSNALAVDAAGNVYTLITGPSEYEVAIAIYSGATGKHLRSVGPFGLRDRRGGIAVAPDGTLFALSDEGVCVISPQGTLALSIKSPSVPIGICLDAQGNLYLGLKAQSGLFESEACLEQGVRDLDQCGYAHRVRGVPGGEVGVDRAGNIYASYTRGGNEVVLVYDAQGNPKHQLEPPYRGSSIAIDSKGNIAVAGCRVGVLDPQGNVIRTLGGLKRGDDASAFSFNHSNRHTVTAITFGPDDKLYVLVQNRVHVFLPTADVTS